jgi:HPt (histidine-containing phosphotransfer) domain-containing protein
VNTLPALDREVFDELHEGVCGQSKTIASLYGTFLNNAEHLIETLRATEPDTVREKTLHTLKGSAAMMGATRIARLAADLQHRSAALDEQALQEAVEHLSSELADVRQAINAQLASLDDVRSL